MYKYSTPVVSCTQRSPTVGELGAVADRVTFDAAVPGTHCDVPESHTTAWPDVGVPTTLSGV